MQLCYEAGIKTPAESEWPYICLSATWPKRNIAILDHENWCSTNSPPPRWIGALVELTKLDCQQAFTPILLVCRPIVQAYRHGNEVRWAREWKRDGVGWFGMAWLKSNIWTHTHIPNTLPNTRKRMVHGFPGWDITQIYGLIQRAHLLWQWCRVNRRPPPAHARKTPGTL